MPTNTRIPLLFFTKLFVKATAILKMENYSLNDMVNYFFNIKNVVYIANYHICACMCARILRLIL